MTLSLQAMPLPLRTEPDGTVRVAGTRVTLDTIVARFKLGDSPQAIAQAFPTLKLPDIYACIAYFLQNEASVEAYLAERETQGKRLRTQVEASTDSATMRGKLRAAKSARARGSC